ncbi:hypothetical protein [Catellatospora sp. NPDC049111]|jgi:hypothetical protein|uniref:hypothetical protein n=1 Tax=unclassified Catellatospora TaxID=2645785 RepID=UPI0033C91119
MHLVKINLRGDHQARLASSEPILTDLIWAHAGQDGGVEHIRVRIRPEAMAIALFIRVADESRAHDAAIELIKRVLDAPAMQGWQLI